MPTATPHALNRGNRALDVIRRRGRELALPLWDLLARASFRSAQGQLLTWRLAQSSLEPLLLSRGWFHAQRLGGAYLPLELLAGDRVVARLALQESFVPGIFRRWRILGEPELLAPGVTQRDTLHALVDLGRHNVVDAVRSSSIFAAWRSTDLPAEFEGARVENVGTYLIDLERDMAAIRNDLHQKHRAALNRAERDGLTVQDGIPTDPFIALMQATYARGGRDNPFDADYLQELIERPRVERLLVSVWHGQALQAALIAAHDRVRGYFVHGVSADSPAQGATVLLHLATMQRLKERGVRCYDFGGVPVGEMSERLAGIARFKQRFGGKFEARARFTLILDDRGRRLGRALGLSEWK